jgi:WD40 repeat protein
MKYPKWYLFIFVLLVSSLLLNACSLSVEVMNSDTNNYTNGLPTPTQELAIPQIDPTLAPTFTPPAPTEVFVWQTPTLISIREGTYYMLENFMNVRQREIVHSLTFTPDGAILASTGGQSENFDICIWDVASGQQIATLTAHTDNVWDLAFSPDGQLLASVSSDRTVKIWDWRAKQVLKTLDFPGEVASVRFSPDGQSLAAGGVDEPLDQIRNAAIWTFAVGSWAPLLKYPEYWNILTLNYSPNGSALVGGGTSRNVQVWNVGDSNPIYTLNHAHQVGKAAISPDGFTLATSTCETVTNQECTDGGFWLWDLPTGRLVRKVGGFPNIVVDLAFTSDGTTLLAGSRDGTLRFYATSDYEPRFETFSPGGISAMALSLDNGLLATGEFDGEIHLWKNVYHP